MEVLAGSIWDSLAGSIWKFSQARIQSASGKKVSVDWSQARATITYEMETPTRYYQTVSKSNYSYGTSRFFSRLTFVNGKQTARTSVPVQHLSNDYSSSDGKTYNWSAVFNPTVRDAGYQNRISFDMKYSLLIGNIDFRWTATLKDKEMGFQFDFNMVWQIRIGV